MTNDYAESVMSQPAVVIELCGKDCYPSREAAWRSARRRWAQLRLRPYRCEFCDDWHLTSNRPRRKRAPVRRPPRGGRRDYPPRPGDRA